MISSNVINCIYDDIKLKHRAYLHNITSIKVLRVKTINEYSVKGTFIEYEFGNKDQTFKDNVLVNDFIY